MQPAKPAGRDGAMGIAFWHDEVMAAMAEDTDGLQPIESPGRLWEQLASDIFLANMKSKVWGWADVRSTWLLDYWKDFEPRLKFVLVVTSPETVLAHAIAAGEEVADLDAIMSTWLAQQQELLRFYHRNTDRCVLVDAQDCAVHPQALVQLCKKQWKLALDTSTALAAEAKAASPISQYLANKLCQGYPEAIGLQHEVAATLSHLAADADAPKAAQAPVSVIDLVADYRALCEGNADNLAQRDADNEARLSALQAQTDQLAQENASLIAANAQLTSAAAELAVQRDSLGKTEEETKQESELLLLQLHQVQEELETYFLKHQEAQGQLDAAKAEVQALQSVMHSQMHSGAHQATVEDAGASTTIAQLTEKLNQLLAERDAETQAKLEAIAQCGRLADDLSQVSAARDGKRQRLAELQARCDAESAARAEALLQRDAEAAAKAEALAAKDAEAHARQEALTRFNTLAKQLEETKQESELLLLQLHQVQEELEHYFLQFQEAQRKVSDADHRWQRMLQRTPAYCDFESIEVLSDNAAVGEHGETQARTTAWRIKNLTAAGRTIAQLEFKTVLESGQAHFVIPRSDGAAGWLTRWPASGTEQTELVVPRDALVADIATQDWQLLKLLGKLLATTLLSPEKLQAPAHFQAEDVREGIHHLGDALEKSPEVLRYDTVTLKREQVNPDYEHLWLSLQNLSLGERQWDAFEFRLSCANVGPKRFGTHPKLEFPEHVGQAPFANWFDESYDDFGAKLELRFALPDAMDITIWGRLAAPDQAFLQALVQCLPSMLGTLQHAGTKLKRAWTDWTHMAAEVQRVVGLRVAALKAPAAAAVLAPTPTATATATPAPAPAAVSVPPPAAVPIPAPVAPVVVRVAQPKAPPAKAKAKPAPAAKARKAK
jgi:hypothetical protein